MNTPTREAQLLLDMNAAADCEVEMLQWSRRQQQQWGQQQQQRRQRDV
jgi:hypothetical protein